MAKYIVVSDEDQARSIGAGRLPIDAALAVCEAYPEAIKKMAELIDRHPDLDLMTCDAGAFRFLSWCLRRA
jgi:hypothetical protein